MDPAAKDILAKSRNYYRTLQAARCNDEVSYASVYNDGRKFSQRISARFLFMAPDRIRVDCTGSNPGDNLSLASNGREVASSHVGRVSTAKYNEAALRATLEEFCGVSAHASWLMPSFLLDVRWQHENPFLPNGTLLEALSQDARLDGTRRIGTDECFVLICKRDLETWELSVRKSDFMIRRVTFSSSKEQMARQRQFGFGGTSGTIGRMEMIHDMTIEKLTDAAEIDASAFEIAR